MIAIRTSEKAPLTVDMWIDPPAVYLDYCVIVRMTEDSRLGREFLHALLGKQGTLLFSWAHLVEIFALGYGPTYEAIKAYLESFGASFAVIDCNASAVLERERVYKAGDPHPALHIPALEQFALRWSGLKPPSLGVLLDGVEEDHPLQRRFQGMHADMKRNVSEMMAEARREYRDHKEVRKRIDAGDRSVLSSGSCLDLIHDLLLRETIATNEAFAETDALDFEHAAVSLAFADYVVLDKKWARRARKLDLPAGSAIVFDITELEAFVSHLRNADGGTST